ncbi:MAG: AAA family ATPase, partial [candidate division GAL15 bacterium]
MELFEPALQSAPLAARMRPRTLEEFAGQEHLVGPGRILRRLVDCGQLASLVLYGPPGTGKTTLAYILARSARAHFEILNAVTSGAADIRRVIQEASDRLRFHGQRTVVFVDEIHRFNRAQQDLLLPHVEDGTLVLVGATTENPFFALTSTLVSRVRILRLEPLSPPHIWQIVQRALQDPERGLGRLALCVDPEALEHLIRGCGGD